VEEHLQVDECQLKLMVLPDHFDWIRSCDLLLALAILLY
jgi:hypothetical protein